MTLLRKLKTIVAVASIALVATTLATALASAALRAQAIGPTTDWTSTRETLTAEVERYRQLAASPAYSEGTRAKAARHVAQLERRLEDGDLRAGDRVMLQVTGSVPIDTTVTVLEGPMLELPRFGGVSVAGVLRSELEAKLREFVTSTVRDASVSVRPLIRVAVYGSVTSPGYQAVPLETRLDELVMLAGGPAPEADPNGMRVMRGDAVILQPQEVLSAIAEGQTVGALGLEEGDRLTVELRTPPWDRATTLQIFTLFAAPLVTLLLVR